MTTVAGGLAALRTVAPLEKRSAVKELPPIPPLDPEHGAECHTAWHQGYLEGIGAALRYLGGDADDDDDDLEDDPDGDEGDNDNWLRGYNWSLPDDYDESIGGIGEGPSEVTAYCPCCGDASDCDCAPGCIGCDRGG